MFTLETCLRYTCACMKTLQSSSKNTCSSQDNSGGSDTRAYSCMYLGLVLGLSCCKQGALFAPVGGARRKLDRVSKACQVTEEIVASISLMRLNAIVLAQQARSSIDIRIFKEERRSTRVTK